MVAVDYVYHLHGKKPGGADACSVLQYGVTDRLCADAGMFWSGMT